VPSLRSAGNRDSPNRESSRVDRVEGKGQGQGRAARSVSHG
jgi:hypothetical protein